MTGVLPKTLVLAIGLALACGCKIGGPRRQINAELGETAFNKILANFVRSECRPLSDAAMNAFPSLQSVADFVLIDSKWYQQVRSKCSADLDVPECWIDALNYLLAPDSLYFVPAAKCICQWAGTCLDPSTIARKRRSTGPQPSSSSTLTKSQSEFANCLSDRLLESSGSYPSHQRFDATSITLFLRNHYTLCKRIPGVPYGQRSLFRLLYLAEVCPKSASWRDDIIEVFRVATRNDRPLKDAIDACDPEFGAAATMTTTTTSTTERTTKRPIVRQITGPPRKIEPTIELLKSQDSVLFSQFHPDIRAEIRFAPANPDQQVVGSDHLLNSTKLIYTLKGKVGQFRGLSASYDAKKVWLNNFRQTSLMRLDITTSTLTTVSEYLTMGLENLAYDQVTEVLYWTDSVNRFIMAMDTSSYKHFAKIWTSEEVSPYGLALHTTKRKLFFGVYKTQGTKISKTELIKCNLDGSGKEVILRFPQVLRPRGITIDFSDDKLFWTDINFQIKPVVLASDLNGRRRREFFAASSGYFWDIAHYGNFIYITDITNSSRNEYNIYIREKNGRVGSVVKTNLRPRNIAIYAPNEVSGTNVLNECGSAKCEHFCVAKSDGYFACKCSAGYRLVSGYKCEANPLVDDYLLVADIGHRRVFQLPLERDASFVNKIVAMPWADEIDEKIYATAVDHKNGNLAWYDLDNKQIVWGNKSIDFFESVVSIVVHCCHNEIFWSTRSEILSWDGISPRYTRLYELGFFSDSRINQITMDCLRDQLYWVEYDLVVKKGRVKRSDWNGKNIDVVLQNLPAVKGITIDYETYTLYVMTIADGMLYSLPLNLLEQIPSTNPNYRQYTATDLSAGFSRNVKILDIRVKNGMAYLAGSKTSHVRRYNISRGPSLMEKYGPDEFFFPASLDFYEKQHYDRYIRESCRDRNTKTEPTTTPLFAEGETTSETTTRRYIRITRMPPSRVNETTTASTATTGFKPTTQTTPLIVEETPTTATTTKAKTTLESGRIISAKEKCGTLLQQTDDTKTGLARFFECILRQRRG